MTAWEMGYGGSAGRHRPKTTALARENSTLNWINDTLGTELSANVQLGIMFVALLLALLVILWLFRRIFGSAGSRIARSRQPRLGVIEAAVVDDTRRLVLVRRDNVEHLLMIGGPGDVVIETRIEQNQPAQPTQSAQPAQAAKAPGHESPDMTPREPRLIEPMADSSPEVAAHQTQRREIAPASEAAAVAAAGAAAVSSVAVHAAEEVTAAIEEPTVEAASTEVAAPAAEVTPEPANTASAVEELALELAGGVGEAAEETVTTAEALEKDLREEAEDDMQKLLDELADAKS